MRHACVPVPPHLRNAVENLHWTSAAYRADQEPKMRAQVIEDALTLHYCTQNSKTSAAATIDSPMRSGRRSGAFASRSAAFSDSSDLFNTIGALTYAVRSGVDAYCFVNNLEPFAWPGVAQEDEKGYDDSGEKDSEDGVAVDEALEEVRRLRDEGGEATSNASSSSDDNTSMSDSD
ncbi:MAG: hypothetical protein M1834_008633 [Cirrosporium novae-zelandiae]|nr:MAG: hypothetical protein M1834_008633 [Cirrosporium novae-zelandiae]